MRRGCGIEALEPRRMLAVSPVTGELRAGTGPSSQGFAAMAMNDTGKGVLVWSDGDVWAKVLPDGAPFRVNTVTAGTQRFPDVAIDHEGDFIVAWDTVGGDISTRRFASDGAPLGDEVPVNASTDGAQQDVSVGCDADGDAVVAWASYPQPGGTQQQGIYAQRYDRDGNPAGAEFPVAADVANEEFEPAVAVMPLGSFVVGYGRAFPSRGEEGPSRMYARRYDATGAAQGDEFQLDTTTGDLVFQSGLDLAVLEGGGFVSAWAAPGPGVSARLYDAQGNPRGAPFAAHAYGSTLDVAVASDRDGGFVLAFDGTSPTAGTGILARRFDMTGAPIGPEFRVNTTSAFGWPAVAADHDGHYAFAWTAQGTTFGSTERDVMLRRYVDHGSLPATLAAAQEGFIYLNQHGDNDDRPSTDAFIDAPGEVDSYLLAAPASLAGSGSFMSIIIGGGAIGGALRPTVALYDPATGALLDSVMTHGGTEMGLVVPWRQYVVAVGDYAGSATGDVTLSAFSPKSASPAAVTLDLLGDASIGTTNISTGNIHYLRVTAPSNATGGLDVTVRPYPSTFDAAVFILDSAGNELARAFAAGPGQPDVASVAAPAIQPGQQAVIAVMARNLAPGGSFTAAIDFATPPLLVPTLCLAGGHDTGWSSDDGLTRHNRPSFTGQTTPDAYVRLFADGVLVAGGRATPNGAFTLAPTANLSEGAHVLTATAGVSATMTQTQTDPSPPLAVVVDVTPPRAAASAFLFETAQRISITPDDEVRAGTVKPWLINVDTGQTTPLGDVAFEEVEPGHWEYRYLPGLIPDGRWRLAAQGTLIDRAGNGLADSVDFAVLAGDATGDGRIDAADYYRIDRGRSLGLGGFSNGDFDYSATAPDASDYLILDAAFLRRSAANLAEASPAPAPPPPAVEPAPPPAKPPLLWDEPNDLLA